MPDESHHPFVDTPPTEEVSLTPTPTQEKKEKTSFFSKFKKSKKDGSSTDSEEKKDAPPKVKFTKLFKYATHSEKITMAIAIIAAIVHGAVMPFFTVIFGGIINSFGDVSEDNFPIDEIVEEIGRVAKWFVVLAGVAFISSFMQVRFQLVVAHGISGRLRKMFFRSLMSQDYTWYDRNDGGELTARVAGDVNVIQNGIGDKFTSGVQFIATFVVGVIIAFVYGPLLTLVILAVAPLLAASGGVFAKLAAESTGDQLGAYGEAGAIANEALGLIRTVTAYGGQKEEIGRYEKKLEKAYKANVKGSVYAGLGLGFMFFIVFCTYAIAFVFGSWRVRNGHITPGDVLTTFFSILIASFSIGQAGPSFKAAASAQGAAPRIFEVIERESEINPLDEDEGETIPNLQGNVRFEKVNFNYATRIVDDVTNSTTRPYVLENFNLNVPPGTSHALVGPSGCGKSTTVRLVERFYDVQDGAVTIDGVDVRKLNVRWLRSQIGYVGQMPTLFMLSIKENIALGAPMEEVVDETSKKVILRRKEVTDDEIIEAAKMANAHDFIMKLPEKYDTLLGERGALLSGGQKQRVCIARALIRNPKLLILDEATAALDAQSERVVQQALEKASAGRTTLIIAHRLSTIRNADVISVIDNGNVIESGTHEKLLQIKNGAYSTLIEHQKVEGSTVQKTSTAGKDTDERTLSEARVLSESISKTVQSRHEAEEDSSEVPNVDKGVINRAFKENAGESPIILLGVIGAAISGASFPVMAIVFSEVIDVLIRENKSEEVRRLAFAFVGIGGAAFFGNFAQLAFLGISGERLTRKLRRASFKKLMKLEMGFFDEKENSLGALTTRLATEASAVKGVTGDTLGSMTFGISSILTGLIISYTACWRVALVVTAVFPLMAVAGALQVKLMTGFDSDSEAKFAGAGTVAAEAVDNIDTVNAIGAHDVFMNRYDTELETPLRNGRRTALIAGIAFGCSEFLSQALWAVSFWVGSIFVESGDCDFLGLMKAITGLLFAGMMLGNMSSTAPDVSKSKVAASKIFRLLDRDSEIDPSLTTGKSVEIEGRIGVDSIHFEYPTRKDVPVLRGASVDVAPGQTLALVGGSGSGKSTIVALMERFYDGKTGRITIDMNDNRELNLGNMRSQMGYVSQDVDLFNRSVRDNIVYGYGAVEGAPVTEEMVVTAAKAANAHSFIADLPEGYDTIVGPRGNRLSGGQRQRVAIARAVMRQPRILLLDEATSALDANSEKVVQEALDHASAGRTTVAIAHRLSTVKDADLIGVVSRGKIAELGTHDQLLRIKNGEYANLVNNQLTNTSGSSS